MSLIDETYFANEPILIPGLSSPSNGYSGELTDGRINNVTRAITRFEPMFLKSLLGVDAYEEFLESESDAKWDDLKAALRDETNKISPIANYVFYNYHLENFVQRGDTGDYIPKADNMNLVTPAYKLSAAWNDMVEQNKVLCKWIYDNILNATVPTVDFENELVITGWYDDELLEYKSILTHFV